VSGSLPLPARPESSTWSETERGTSPDLVKCVPCGLPLAETRSALAPVRARLDSCTARLRPPDPCGLLHAERSQLREEVRQASALEESPRIGLEGPERRNSFPAKPVTVLKEQRVQIPEHHLERLNPVHAPDRANAFVPDADQLHRAVRVPVPVHGSTD